MFRPTEMQKVRLIVLKSRVEELITALHEVGLVDIKRTRLENLSEGRPLQSFDEVSQQRLRLRAIASVLDGIRTSINLERSSRLEQNLDATSTSVKPALLDIPSALSEARKITVDSELKQLTKESSRILDEIKTYESHLAVANKLKEFKGVDFSLLKSRTLTYRVGELPHSKLEKLDRKLGKALSDYSVIPSVSEKDRALVLILYRDQSRDIDPILSEVGFEPIIVPQGLTKAHPTISLYHNEINDRKARLAVLNDRIMQLSHDNYSKIISVIHSLGIAAARSEVSSRFAFSNRMCVLEGWVKKADVDELERTVSRFGNDLSLEKISFGHDEIPPTVLANPKPAGPFEFLTQSYSFPNYFEIDPTMAYLVFVPILYGMIVGDVIYGLISLVLSWFIMGKFRNSYVMSNVSKLWFYSAFPSIVFGIIFDEWGAMTHFHLIEYLGKWGLPMFISGPVYTGFSRIHNLDMLIGITALIGLVHLGIGFIMGAINQWNHHRKHAYAKIAWLGVEIGGTVVVCALMLGILPSFYGIYGGGLLGVSIVVLLLTEGIIGVLEVPGLVGNVLSYARIAAIGIVGVILAEIINEFLIPLPSQGIFAILLLPIFVLLHGVNAFIAMFEALIQCGRLNIIEFRSKFLTGGGIQFKPFALRSEK